MRNVFPAFFIAAISVVLGADQALAEQQTTFSFATIEQGKEILTRKDSYIKNLSPFDRSSRLQTDREVSPTEHLKLLGKSPCTWTDEEKQRIESVLSELRPRFDRLALPFPSEVLFIKTTGEEEAGAAYTRSNAVILPKEMIAQSGSRLKRLVAHELFHVLTRSNPELRKRLYPIIGFEYCGEVPFPESLFPRKISNPDTPWYDHCIQVKYKDESVWGVPILLSRTEKYDVKRGGPFFQYLQFLFLQVDRDPKTGKATVVLRDGKPVLLPPIETEDFIEKIGTNTFYIIHPEEILADNFALLMTGQDCPMPQILDKMERVFKEYHAKAE